MSSSCTPAFTPDHIPFVSTFSFLLGEAPLIHGICSNFSLPQTHPKHPRAALLHAICAVASVYTPAVSNPQLYGTRGNTSRLLSRASCFLIIGFVFRRNVYSKAKRGRSTFHFRRRAGEICCRADRSLNQPWRKFVGVPTRCETLWILYGCIAL